MNRLQKTAFAISFAALAASYNVPAIAAEESTSNVGNPLVESLVRLNKSRESFRSRLVGWGKHLIGLNNEARPAVALQPHVVLDQSLAILRDEFNAKAGTVRLLFIVGPTCGQCLWGMESIDRALLAENSDPRLHTFVVHVPALGAEEKDVEPATQFLTGMNITHYWEDTGVIGDLYGKLYKDEVVGMAPYSWDVWMIYGPGARWDGKLPPKPDYWVYLMRDAEKFAAKTRSYMPAN